MYVRTNEKKSALFVVYNIFIVLQFTFFNMSNPETGSSQMILKFDGVAILAYGWPNRRISII